MKKLIIFYLISAVFVKSPKTDHKTNKNNSNYTEEQKKVMIPTKPKPVLLPKNINPKNSGNSHNRVMLAQAGSFLRPFQHILIQMNTMKKKETNNIKRISTKKRINYFCTINYLTFI